LAIDCYILITYAGNRKGEGGRERSDKVIKRKKWREGAERETARDP